METHHFSSQTHDTELQQLREENRLSKERITDLEDKLKIAIDNAVKYCDIIKELEKALPKWNNLMEGEMPEDGQECLVSDGKNIYKSEFLTDFEDGEYFAWFDACEECNWWMDMPKPPKKDVK